VTGPLVAFVMVLLDPPFHADDQQPQGIVSSTLQGGVDENANQGHSPLRVMRTSEQFLSSSPATASGQRALEGSIRVQGHWRILS
jgi:hypothetical protein